MSPSSIVRRAFVSLAFCIASASCIPKDAPGASPASAADLKACGPTATIEDAEDNNNQVIVQDGRSGYVYTFLDKAGSTISPNTDTGDLTLAEGGAEGSKYAIRIKGKVGTADIVYAGIGINFIDPKAEYNASKYKGISFYAKAGPGSTSNVRLKVPDVSTDPAGKKCSECFNDFGYDLTLGPEWKKFTIPFSEMTQLPGWGSPQPGSIDPTKIYGVQFQVNDKGADYDVWFDQVQFVGCG